jgi:hypothetical protein
VNRFTQGQKDRIRATAIIAPRASLLTSQGCGVSGTNEINNTNEFSIFPNPAQHEIHVNIDANLIGTNFELYDPTGKVVLLGKLTSENSLIDLSSLSGGIYLFKIEGDIKQHFKVIKE